MYHKLLLNFRTQNVKTGKIDIFVYVLFFFFSLKLHDCLVLLFPSKVFFPHLEKDIIHSIVSTVPFFRFS